MEITLQMHVPSHKQASMQGFTTKVCEVLYQLHIVGPIASVHAYLSTEKYKFRKLPMHELNLVGNI